MKKKYKVQDILDIVHLYPFTGELSLDMPLSEDSNTTAIEMIVSPYPTPEQELERLEAKQFIENLSYLTCNKDVELLKQLYGIGCPEKTIAELAEERGVTRQAIEFSKNKAIVELRKMCKKYNLTMDEPFLNRQVFKRHKDNPKIIKYWLDTGVFKSERTAYRRLSKLTEQERMNILKEAKKHELQNL